MEGPLNEIRGRELAVGDVISLTSSSDVADPAPVPATPGGSDRVFEASGAMPSEFKTAISAISGELGANLAVLGTQIGAAERAQRETLKSLDGLFERLGQRVREQIQTLERECADVKTRYDSAQAQFDDYQKRYEGLQQNYADAETQFETMQQRYTGVQQQFKGVQHQFEGLNRELQAMQQSFEGLTERSDVAQRVSNETAERCAAIEQKFVIVQDLEKSLAANVDAVAAVRATLDDEDRRRGNIEISIGEMAREIGKLGPSEVDKISRVVDRLEAAAAGGRKRQRLAICLSFLALIVAGYIALGKPGWQHVTDPVATLFAQMRI
jgi:chromosome segregation ATPase